MSWSALIQWGDRVVRVSGIDVTLEQRIDLAAKEAGYTPQQVQIAAILPYDAAAYMYGDGWTPAQAAVVIEDENGDTVRGYPVIDITPGRDGELTTFVCGNTRIHESSQIPSTATDLVIERVNVERTNKKRGNIAERIVQLQSLVDDLEGSWGHWGNRYGVIGDRAEVGALAKARARLEHNISRRNFVSFDTSVEGRTYPLIFGKPGRCDATIRAISCAMVDDVNELVMIAGHVATLGTCQLFGPKVGSPDDQRALQITQSTHADQAGTVYTGIDASGLALYFAQTPDSTGRSWFAAYADAQTAEGLPSDIGGALALLMGHTVGALVDFPAFGDMTARLPGGRVDGVVDQVTSAWDLLSMSMLPLMPVQLVDGEHGIRPVYTGTDRDWTEAQQRLVEGPSFAGMGAPALTSGAGIANDITVAYAYDADDKNYRRSVHLSALDVGYLADSRARYGYRPMRIETAWCYDDATAGQIARHVAHRLHSQLMSLEYLATPSIHGAGGADELVIGDIVRLTDARYAIADRLAMVTRVSLNPARLVIGLTVLESTIPEYVSTATPPAPPPTIYILAAGDNGSSQSAARTSTNDGVTWAAVSGLPAEGVLNGTAYDADTGVFLAAGQSGASVIISKDGSSVTDVAVGGTANREGVGYRGAAETGGALWVVVGQAGRLDYSANGSSWTTVTGFGSIALYFAFYHDDYWYVGGNSGRIWYSANGTSGYTACNPTGSQRTVDMAWTGTHLIVCRRSGKIAYATPTNARAASWTAPSTGTSSHLHAIASDGAGAVVAVGRSGTIIHSTDHGATWASRTSGTSNHLNGITWNGSVWIVVADGGIIGTSADGITWTPQTSGTSDDLMWVENSAGYP